MNKKSEINIGYALLAVQSALLGIIIPALRSVSVNLDEQKKIFYMKFYYHGKISNEIVDLWECATTEASASLGPEYFTEYEIKRLDYPSEVPHNGRYAYLRKE